ADALGMQRVFIHPLAGVLSAYGMGLADQVAMREASLEAPLDATGIALAAQRLATLAQQAADEVHAQGVAREDVKLRRRYHLRYQGTDTALVVEEADEAAMRAAFDAAYRQRYAFLMPGKPLVIEAVSVEAIGEGERLPEPHAQAALRDHAPAPHAAVRMHAPGEDGASRWHEAALHLRESLAPGARI